MFNDVEKGRERASEIASLLHTTNIDFLYGERNGGIGYCTFTHSDDNLNEWASTVRTSQNEYIKMNEKLLIGNQDRCFEHEINHDLFLAFNWNTNRSVYRIKYGSIENCVSSLTKNLKHLVFRKSLLDYKMKFNNDITKLL